MIVVALLFMATTINYMDRQVLGLLAPTLEKAIGWNDIQYGWIVVAFQAAYAIGQIGFGWMIDRWGTKRGYSISIIVWSLAAAAHALARNVFGFSVARFALGIGEAGNFPAAIKSVAEWFPKKERALATGIFNAGSTVGAIFAPLIVPPLAARYGWQSAFIVLGGVGFIWLALWLAIYRRPEASDRQSTSAGRETSGVNQRSIQAANSESTLTQAVGPEDAAIEPVIPVPIRWSQLLKYPQTWAYNLQSLCVQPIWWFYLFWLPKFFHERYSLELQKSGRLLAITYTMSMTGSIFGGILSARLLRRGWSVNSARKTALLICATLTLPMTAVVHVENVWFATLLIGLALAGMQGWAANAYTIVSDLFPTSAVASVVGLGSACGSVAAMAMLVGSVLQKSGSYSLPFLIAGIFLPLAVVLLQVLVPRWEAIESTDKRLGDEK